MSEKGLSRRRLLTVGAVVGAAPLAPAAAQTFQNLPHVPFEPNSGAFPEVAKGGNDFLYFNPAEQAFVNAAVARMIPKDDLGAGGIEAGVPQFIDRQLAGDFGTGANWYMQGPWGKGETTQGYQSRMSPAQMYRAAIPAIDQAAGQAHGRRFADLAPADQDTVLRSLEKGDLQLSGGVDAKAFFSLFLQNVIEGFFSDPLYGGNRDMVGWKLIGFSGARYDQRAYVKTYGQPYPLPPVGITGRPDWGKS